MKTSRNSGVLLALVAAVSTAWIACPSGAQEQPARTSWGTPDISGVWDYRSATPLQAALGPEELSESEADTTEEDQPEENQGRVFDEPWHDRGQEHTEFERAFLLVDPPDGRLPSRTEYGESIARDFWLQMKKPPVGPEDRTVFERCIVSTLIPLESIDFNNNIKIFQTPGFVVVLNEMVHEARIIRMEGGDRLPAGIRQWLGESRGSWDGDTLVVETRGFKKFAHPLGTSADMRIVERFMPLGSQRLSYEYTITDPKIFNRPWTARQTFNRSPHQIYEYACHEGNQSMPLMLKGAREEERRAAELKAGDARPEQEPRSNG